MNTQNSSTSNRSKLIKDPSKEIKKLIENDKNVAKVVKTDRFTNDFDKIFKM